MKRANDGSNLGLDAESCRQRQAVPNSRQEEPPTDSQRRAISAAGNVLVVAGAGTGKPHPR